MYTLLAIGLTNAACAAVLAVPAYLAGRKGRTALSHALWLLVLIKLVTPPFFHLPLPWLPADEPASRTATTSEPAEQAWQVREVVSPSRETAADFHYQVTSPANRVAVVRVQP